MESVDAGDRKWACVAVSNLIQNDPSTRRLLQGKNIVKALIDRLTDTEEEVVIEAMGSLRYVCFWCCNVELYRAYYSPATFVWMEALTFVQRCTTRTY